MWRQALMAVIGLGGGMIAAGGVTALLIGLGITPRYAAITHTGDLVMLYEDVTVWGAVLGNIVQLYHTSLSVGNVGLGIYGLFSGIFLGGWILALAEMVDIFPITLRRLKLQVGIPWIITTIAAAKIIGSLFYFWENF